MREGELGCMHSDLLSIDPRPRYNVEAGSVQNTPTYSNVALEWV